MFEPRFTWTTRSGIDGVADRETGKFYGFTHPMIGFTFSDEDRTTILFEFSSGVGTSKYTPTPMPEPVTDRFTVYTFEVAGGTFKGVLDRETRVFYPFSKVEEMGELGTALLLHSFENDDFASELIGMHIDTHAIVGPKGEKK